MIVSIIAAMDKKRGIGFKNNLPWRLSADLKRFRELTMGHHIIVGRKTYESIGRPLPGRRMIIVTREKKYQAEGCDISNSIEAALDLAREAGEKEVFICGGSEIYTQTIDVADRMYLTFVDTEVEADAFFPEFDDREWSEGLSVYQPADEKNQFPFTFKILTTNQRSQR